MRAPSRTPRQQPLRKFVVNAAPFELVQERPIPALPRSVTRIKQRLPESFVVDEADLNQSRHRSTNVNFRISRSDETLFEVLA